MDRQTDGHFVSFLGFCIMYPLSCHVMFLLYQTVSLLLDLKDERRWNYQSGIERRRIRWNNILFLLLFLWVNKTEKKNVPLTLFFWLHFGSGNVWLVVVWRREMERKMRLLFSQDKLPLAPCLRFYRRYSTFILFSSITTAGCNEFSVGLEAW